LPYSSDDAISILKQKRGSFCDRTMRIELRHNFESSGIHVSKQLLAALIIARNSFR